MGLKHTKTKIVGICGISRAGKTTLRYALLDYIEKNYKKKYKIEHFSIDEYYMTPLYVYDNNLKQTIIDDEEPEGYAFNEFIERLKNIRDNNTCDICIVEGFLLYTYQDVEKMIDFKYFLDVDKEICFDRRKKTKTYYSDYYLEEYIWKGFFRHNVFLDNCTHINTNGNLKEIEKVFIEDVSKKLGLK
jgi:uridine kinase